MIHARADYNCIQDDPDRKGAIPENEPVFLIRAQDKFGAALVRLWADINAAHGGDPDLIRMALAHADKMQKWPVKKTADFRTDLAPADSP